MTSYLLCITQMGPLGGGVIGNDQVLDNTLAESKLSPAVQAKLNAVSGVTSVAGKTGAVTLTSSDVGLGSVDDTSDASKNSAAATLTNKTISGSSNTLSDIPESAVTNLVSDLAGKAASSHTHALDDLSALGTPNNTTYLRGDGRWYTPFIVIGATDEIPLGTDPGTVIFRTAA